MIKTHPSVITVYQQHGKKFGSSLNESDVKRRFKAARRKLFSVDTSARDQVAGELISSDNIERDLWRDFIEDVFIDVSNQADLFEELWQFFAVPENWRVYDDTEECICQMKRAGHYVLIASNFDSRLIPIVNYFKQLSLLDDVFCSAAIGYRKPDPAFYDEVLRRVSHSVGTEVAGDDIIFAGDCIENDFHGPRRAGWTALWLDREGEPGDASDCPDKYRISSLSELPDAVRKISG